MAKEIESNFWIFFQFVIQMLIEKANFIGKSSSVARGGVMRHLHPTHPQPSLLCTKYNIMFAIYLQTLILIEILRQNCTPKQHFWLRHWARGFGLSSIDIIEQSNNMLKRTIFSLRNIEFQSLVIIYWTKRFAWYFHGLKRLLLIA